MDDLNACAQSLLIPCYWLCFRCAEKQSIVTGTTQPFQWPSQPSSSNLSVESTASNPSKPRFTRIANGRQSTSKPVIKPVFGDPYLHIGLSQKPSSFNFNLSEPSTDGSKPTFFGASSSKSQPSFGAAARLPTSSFGASSFAFPTSSQTLKPTAPSKSLFHLPSSKAAQERTSTPPTSTSCFSFGLPPKETSTSSQTFGHALSLNQATQHQASCLNEPIAGPSTSGLNAGQSGNATGKSFSPADIK